MKRYDFDWRDQRPTESPTGDYVLYSDFEKLVEALKFYAEQKSYSTDYDTSENGFIRRCVLYGDIEELNQSFGVAGMRARQALKELEIK